MCAFFASFVWVSFGSHLISTSNISQAASANIAVKPMPIPLDCVASCGAFCDGTCTGGCGYVSSCGGDVMACAQAVKQCCDVAREAIRNDPACDGGGVV